MITNFYYQFLHPSVNVSFWWFCCYFLCLSLSISLYVSLSLCRPLSLFLSNYLSFCLSLLSLSMKGVPNWRTWLLRWIQRQNEGATCTTLRSIFNRISWIHLLCNWVRRAYWQSRLFRQRLCYWYLHVNDHRQDLMCLLVSSTSLMFEDIFFVDFAHSDNVSFSLKHQYSSVVRVIIAHDISHLSCFLRAIIYSLEYSN